MTDLLDRLKSALADRYAIESELGSGGMAIVYLAEDTKHHRQVAVKVLRPELAAALGAERFLREIEITARLEHPHILTLLDSGEAGGFLYYAMPYVEGESLRDRLDREKQLPLEDALQIARNVAAALSYAHSHDVLHRDIKPENILLSGGEAVVADFGISRAITAAGGDKLTETGVSIGTPTYMSPEQAAGSKDLDGRSDTYSLGCLLYEMLAGDPPFAGPTVESIVHQHLSAEPPVVTVRRPATPIEVAEALNKALAKTPADRFVTAAQFSEALTPVQAQRTTATAVAAVKPRTRRNAIAYGAIAILAIIGAYTIVSQTVSSPEPAAASAGPRLVVLPFENLGSPDDEYFADGISEEITARLAGVTGLGVVSRNSAVRYKNSDKTLKEIGEDLDVEYVLEGTIRWQRAEGASSRVRVTPQLIRVSDDVNLWAATYEEDLTEIFQVQSNIAERVAEALDITLLEPERVALGARPTDNLEAYDRFLRANYYLAERNPRSLGRAIEEYETALELDPQFTEALARIAYTYALFLDWGWDYRSVPPESLLTRGLAAADRALAEDSTKSDAWMARGYLLAFQNPRTFEGVSDAFERALALDPRNSEAHHQYGYLLHNLGETDGGMSHAHRALEIDPRRAATIAEFAEWANRQRRFDEARQWADSALGVEPGYSWAYSLRTRASLQLGEITEALSDARLTLRFSAGDSVVAQSALAMAHLHAGDTVAALGWVEMALNQFRRTGGHVTEFEKAGWVAMALVTLGQDEQALQLLERVRPRGVLFWDDLKAPEFDPIRSHPRFQRLVEESRPLTVPPR